MGRYVIYLQMFLFFFSGEELEMCSMTSYRQDHDSVCGLIIHFSLALMAEVQYHLLQITDSILNESMGSKLLQYYT